MKILNFFLYMWFIFALLDPDPATQINADPDPQPCPPVFLIRYGYREMSIIRHPSFGY
jgi:hypothetical protein